MRFLKKIFRLTPLRLSVFIALFFALIAAVHDIKPDLIPVVGMLSDKSIDMKFNLRGSEAPKSKIVVVTIDEKALATYGQWPFDRGQVMAPLLRKLCEFNTKTVGLDIVWPERERQLSPALTTSVAEELKLAPEKLQEIISQNSGDTVLRKALEACGPKVVLGYALSKAKVEGLEPAEFEKRAKLLVEQGKNKLVAQVSGDIVYARYFNDPDANVSFHHVAESGVLNLPELTPANVAQGFFNNEKSSDGNYRRVFLVQRVLDNFVPALSLRMAQKVLSPSDNPPFVILRSDGPGREREFRLQLEANGASQKLPTDEAGQLLINYRGPNRTYPNVSMADVMSPADSLEFEQYVPHEGYKTVKMHKRELFQDALVLVGATATGIYDIRPRPLDGGASGVENHANIIDNILANDFLERPTAEMLLLALLGVIIFSLGFGWVINRSPALIGFALAVVSIGGVLWFDQVYLFNRHNIVYAGYLLAIQLLFQYVAITVMKYMAEENEKKFIRSAFDKYVSPAVINTMLSDPARLRLGGEKKELSIMFSDIRGFTQLSERVDVKALTQFLNEYLGSMTDILQKNGGTLDKYIGDAVMGFWGAPIDMPNHAENAVKTTVEMVQKLDELNVNFQRLYGFTIDIGLGINSGAVSVGNFGSSKVFEYTVIGDNVNLASRLEGLNKYYGTHIIISEFTYQSLTAGTFPCREIDTVRVKGKKKPVKIYEVFPDDAKHSTLKSALPLFNEALLHYYEQKWDKALQHFQKVLQTRDADRPTLELMERCRHYNSNPPGTSWDGSWEMHSK